MILQTILQPNERTCKETEMYYREETGKRVYNTYFNLLSIEKWRKYTSIQTYQLYITAVGHFSIELYDTNRKLTEQVFHFTEPQEITMKIPYREDSFCVYFAFVPVDPEARLISGRYETPEASKHTVKLALDICTYRREAYVERNLKVLRDSILDQPASPLHDKVDVYIIDNGRTLDANAFASDKIHVIPNINAGGTGGFTRGAMEILKRKDFCGYTHMIFMDDDAVLEPDAIVRTFALLSFLRDQYRTAAVGGAMLRLDLRYVLHETGTHWQGTDPVIPYPGMDLRQAEQVYLNERIPGSDYAPWWFGCYSLEVVRHDNLPIPFFLHMDDVEYGIRQKQEVILLNGINVWHQSFENKRASNLSYYDVRNIMITNAVYAKDGRKRLMTRYILKRMLANLLRYRYRDVKLVYDAVRDFCRGIDDLETLEPEAKNQAISKAGYTMKPVEELTKDAATLAEIYAYREPENPAEIYHNSHKAHSLRYLLTLNGWIFPSHRDKIYVYPAGIWPAAFYRKQDVILFDPETHKGIRVHKSWKMMFQCIGIIIKTLGLMNSRYNQARQGYHDRIRETWTEEFWKGYLRLDK